MATATYTIKYDAESRTWDVLDEQGDVYEACDTRAEAVATVKRLAREEEVERLYDAINVRIGDAEADGDLDTLRKVAALLGL